MIIQVKANKEAGFRRCGVGFTNEWSNFDEGFFTHEELERLDGEKNLSVRQMPEGNFNKEEMAAMRDAAAKRTVERKAAEKVAGEGVPGKAREIKVDPALAKRVADLGEGLKLATADMADLQRRTNLLAERLDEVEKKAEPAKDDKKNKK